MTAPAPRKLRTAVLLVILPIAALLAVLWAPSHAAATRHSCGVYRSESIYPSAQVFSTAGVSCQRALRVAKRFDHQGHAPGPWQCFLGHGGRHLFSCGYPLPAAGGPISDARHALWARGVGATNSSADHKPPVFAGLTSAVTCIGGPGIGSGASRYTLRWNPATEDPPPASPQPQIVYDIYQASVSGGEDFSTPTYTTAPGATSFTTPPLSNSHPWYFVVRARDRAGNRDSNRVERVGQNLCV